VKKTIKYKKSKPVRLPPAPDLTKIRGSFRELSLKLREARMEYLEKCWLLGTSKLKGKALAQFISRVATKCQEIGLYAQSTYVGDIRCSVLHWFYRFETRASAIYWSPAFKFWLHKYNMRVEDIRGERPGRGRRRLPEVI
jgi:hypothetical protein